jgi:hypothetical protein
MKLSKTLWCVSFIVIAVFSMPVLALTPLGQIDSFDNIAATGWTEPTGTGLMAQDSNTFHEGSGSIRVKFEDMDPCEWDVDLERVIALNLDYNEPVALTFWVDHNATGDECVRELKVFQGTNVVRFAIPQMSAGWHKVVAPTNLFTVVAGSSFDWAAVDKIQFFCSTWDNPGGSVWIDDLRLELVTPQMKLYQIDSMDNVIDPCDPDANDENDNFWHDNRRLTGYMKQEDVNVNEGTGSMKIDFTMYPSGTENGFDIEPIRNFQTDLDFTHYEDLAITVWVWTDVEILNKDSELHQIILYDNLPGCGRFTVPAPSVAGWRKVIAPLNSFGWEGSLGPGNPHGDPNWAAIGKIGLWASCYEDPGNEIYMDDLCVELAHPPLVLPFQIASFDDIAEEGWSDDRHTGYMRQEVNDVNIEGTGSMRIAFADWPGQGLPAEANDISVLFAFPAALDFNDSYKNWAITVWIWSDPAGDSQVNQILLNAVGYEAGSGQIGRYNVPPPVTAGWQKVTANLAEFIWEPINGWPGAITPDNARWDKILSVELYASCSRDPNINNSDIYYDDLRFDSNQVLLSEARIVNADYGTITVDGNAADWAALVDSDIVDFDLAAVPEPNGNLHVKYRLAWDPNYLYMLVQEQTGDTCSTEANLVGDKNGDWSLNDQAGGDYYYDNLSLCFDFTNNHWPGTDGSVSLWLFLGLNSKGSTDMMMAWANDGVTGWVNTAGQRKHRPLAIVDGSVATSGTLGHRITEAKVSWSVLAGYITPWRLPEGGLLAAIKPGYIFGCDPRLSDYELANIILHPELVPTPERGRAWLNGEWRGPTGRDIYSTDVRLVYSAGDLDFDYDVDFVDLQVLAENWLDDDCNNLNDFCNGADIVINGKVNFVDYAQLALRWLE